MDETKPWPKAALRPSGQLPLQIVSAMVGLTLLLTVIANDAG